MAELKTKQNDASVTAFLDGLADEKRRQDSYAVLSLMKKITGLEPKMWGDSIIGFGTQHYKYASGREGDMPLTGFSPRKQNLTLYIGGGFDNYQELLSQLGKHKLGKVCLYLNRLADADLAVLEELIGCSIVKQESARNAHGGTMELGNFSVSLAVKDLEASKQFYSKLGFAVFMGDQSQNWLIMKNGDHVIGLFQGMFEMNILTFNPGWDSEAQPLSEFTDIRELQRKLKAQGITMLSEADENSAGPASFMIVDPDGNTILFDQHI